MQFTHKLTVIAALAAPVMAFAGTANATIVYNRTATVGAATAQISITTDGTLGLLAPVGGISVHNVPAITDWTVSLATPYGSTVFGKNIASPGLAPEYNSLFFAGQNFDPARTVLNATPQQLALNSNFVPGETYGVYFRVLDPFTFLDKFSYTGVFNASVQSNVETVVFKDEFGISRVFGGPTNASIAFEANPATAGVPEPATWAMMIAGFGMVGAGMRRRKTSVHVSFG